MAHCHRPALLTLGHADIMRLVDPATRDRGLGRRVQGTVARRGSGPAASEDRRAGKGFTLAMLAYAPGQMIALKTVSVFHGNHKLGLASHQALVSLFDAVRRARRLPSSMARASRASDDSGRRSHRARDSPARTPGSRPWSAAACRGASMCACSISRGAFRNPGVRAKPKRRGRTAASWRRTQRPLPTISRRRCAAADVVCLTTSSDAGDRGRLDQARNARDIGRLCAARQRGAGAP